MNIHVTGRKIEITPALRQHAEEKINKALKYINNVIDVHIIMSVEKYVHTVEMTFNLERQKIFAKESSGDMYSSIDLAIEKIIKQLRRYHDRIKDHKSKTKPWEETEK